VSTPTDFTSTDVPSGRVLTHPAFDRPPVRNERRPGPKKGTLSFAKAVRHRVWQPDQAHRDSAAPAAPDAGAPHQDADAWNARAKDQSAPPPNLATGREKHEQAVIDAALAILEAGFRKPGELFDSPRRAKDYARLQLASLDHEVFAVFYLDTQHRLIAFEVPFRGTLASTQVHPREIVKRALELAAGAVVLAHNHPSGIADPSRADEQLTAVLRSALAQIDVRVIDHLVVGHDECTSFAERGLL
jgi:hypothetical protein